ncbi:MAG TPA: pyridoxamine 5'-phosphate oxidase family protein [Pseudonocardiaceae bacterium]|jgi:hypothetical protein|nr:pyridoxamine 5'-phosphate oxidase family protein [Pseudonocardiaceae bacterium]
MAETDGLELLDRTECLALLRTVGFGRVVFTNRALPAVRPVRFTLDGDSLLLAPIPEGGPVTETPGAVLAFEADSFSADLTTGWYVVVVGRADDTGIGIELVRGWRLATRPEPAEPEVVRPA